jgi:hypothetical protein
MSKMILVSQVAAFGRQLEKLHSRGARESVAEPVRELSWSLRSLMDDTTVDGPDPFPPVQNNPASPETDRAENVIDSDNKDVFTGSLRDSERMKIVQLLDEWEEPERKLENPVSKLSPEVVGQTYHH